jgi:hypothetical protein
MRFEDPDMIIPRWFTTAVLGNVTISSVEHLLDQRTGKLMDSVINNASTLMLELTSKDISAMKLASRAFVHSVTQDTKTQAEWLLQHFSDLVTVATKLSGA